MRLLRKSSVTSMFLMNICKGHMSLSILLSSHRRCNHISLKKANNNVKLLMTLAGDIEINEPTMSPSPPFPTQSDDVGLRSTAIIDKLEASSEKNDCSKTTNPSCKSDLVQLSKEFNKFYFNGFFNGHCKPLYCQGCQVGLVRKDVEDAIKPFNDVFSISTNQIDILSTHETNTQNRSAFDEISANIDVVLRSLRDSPNHDFVALKGWRNECYNIRAEFSAPPLFKMERSATCMFGLRQYGVDINGYVNDPEKGLCVWMQRRSVSKPTWPGKWDNFVSGGLSTGFTVNETVIKEAVEEANVPEYLFSSLKPAGCVTFFFESERGIFPQTEFVFDLELPISFTPTNNDGEVDEFALTKAADLPSRLLLPDMKTTSCPVTIDFLIRKGIINSNTEPNLPELSELLHIPLHTIYKKETK